MSSQNAKPSKLLFPPILFVSILVFCNMRLLISNLLYALKAVLNGLKSRGGGSIFKTCYMLVSSRSKTRYFTLSKAII